MGQKHKPPTYLSIFSGCGGMDLGFERAGYKGLLSVDIDKNALDVLKRNLSTNTQAMDLSISNPNIPGPFDVLLAGSPCQGFSTIGLRKLDDARNDLIFVAPRIAREWNPKVIIIENVPGVLAGDHKIYWIQLKEKLSNLKYKTAELKIDCSEHGLAQSRIRIVLIAWNTGKEIDIDLPRFQKRSLSEVLEIPADTRNHDRVILKVTSNDFKIAQHIQPGQKLTNSRGGNLSVHTWQIPEVFGRTNLHERNLLEEMILLRRRLRRRKTGDADPVSLATLKTQFLESTIEALIKKEYLRKLGSYVDLTSTFNGKYRRLKADAPSRTVDTRFGDPRLFLHPAENRGFTVREAARLQGFPDSFVFDGTPSQQYRMVGNAVPPPIAQLVANLTKELLK